MFAFLKIYYYIFFTPPEDILLTEYTCYSFYHIEEIPHYS